MISAVEAESCKWSQPTLINTAVVVGCEDADKQTVGERRRLETYYYLQEPLDAVGDSCTHTHIIPSYNRYSKLLVRKKGTPVDAPLCETNCAGNAIAVRGIDALVLLPVVFCSSCSSWAASSPLSSLKTTGSMASRLTSAGPLDLKKASAPATTAVHACKKRKKRRTAT